MMERFTDKAIRVMALANQEAQKWNHEYIGTEHILLGFIREGSGVGFDILENMEVNFQSIKTSLEYSMKAGPSVVSMGKLPRTPRAKEVIERSIEFARKIGDKHVGTEHLIYGLLVDKSSVSSMVLINEGLTIEKYENKLIKKIDQVDVIKSCRNCLCFKVCFARSSIENLAKLIKVFGVNDIEENIYQLMIKSCIYYRENKDE